MTVKRNTWQKDAVRQALDKSLSFVSAGQLHQELKNQGSSIGLATVYRALTDLAKSGEADSLQSKDGETLYRACTNEHHHHLICRSCAKTVEIDGASVEDWASKIAKQYGFQDVTHTIDLFGVCSNCSNT